MPHYLFDNSNYMALSNSGAILLISYLNNNIDKYVENVYLKILTNRNEEEKYLIELLNRDDLGLDNSELIINQVETQITDLSSINYSELYPTILKKNRIFPKWENLLHEYNNQSNEEEEARGENLEVEKEISNSCIAYINILENAIELSKTKVSKEKGLYNKFWRKVMQNNDISDQAYDLITKSSPWWYNASEFVHLTENKIRSLINNDRINPIAESYHTLKENFKGLNILLFEKHKNKYFEILTELTFDSEDLERVLKSSVLSNVEKLKITATCNEEIVIGNNLNLLCTIILEENSNLVSPSILSSILISNNVPQVNRIKLFIKRYLEYDVQFITNFLRNLDNEYSQITDSSTKAKIQKNGDNNQLLKILEDKKYISTFSDKGSYFMVNHKRK